jgi:hypothetical protein
LAGSLRSTLPALMAAATFFGTASMSTLSPSSSAFFGLSPGPTPPSFSPARVLWSLSFPPQNSWLPNVSKRKIFLPSARYC